ncbi:S24 family peptidase [Pseudomonas sp. A014]|uniref:S24 family peptidase n=1 Tax=Pseudomonas sp. A014 TaxID=3458058 RepID=UPI0040372BD4
MDIYEIRRSNLRELVTERFNGRIAGLAEAIDRAPSYLSRCLTGKTEHRKRIGESLARDIEDRLDLPRFWLDVICATGETRKQPAAAATDHPELADLTIWDDQSPIEDDEVVVPYLHEVELAAGSGRFAIEQTEGSNLRFGKRSLRKNGVQFDSARCVTVRGNSMLPVLRDGAIVGVDVAKSSFGDIIDGDIYALNHNGQLRIKQVYRTPTGIRLRSFNRDEYPDEEYSFNDVQDQGINVLGHVFWWGMFAR